MFCLLNKSLNSMTKKDKLQQELVDLNEVIREMMLLLHSEATQFAVSIWTELAADVPEVKGDRVQLQQVTGPSGKDKHH